MTTEKSGRQLCWSAASTAGYRRFSKCVLIAADRCPPAENPSTPILCGSTCSSAARERTSLSARCASCSAVGAGGLTWHLHRSSQWCPESGTRYFSSTQVIPLLVSQSQTSVPVSYTHLRAHETPE